LVHDTDEERNDGNDEESISVQEVRQQAPQ
jgi:hypothetical protein